jgi:hypothetical protein
MKTKRKIIQIIPATGWCAVYQYEGKDMKFPLVCWGLYDDDGEVVGMDTGGDPIGPEDCSVMRNFLRYEHESVSSPNVRDHRQLPDGVAGAGKEQP